MSSAALVLEMKTAPVTLLMAKTGAAEPPVGVKELLPALPEGLASA